jgi:hypothetical protein
MPMNITGMYLPVAAFLPKWLTNPWGYIHDQFIDLYNNIGELFQHYIINAPGAIPEDFKNHQFGEFLALSAGLSITVLMILLVTSLFTQRAIYPAFQSFWICVAIGVFGPAFYYFVDWLVQVGTDITRKVAGSQDYGHLVLLPEIHSTFGAIFATIFTGSIGGVMVLWFLSYVGIIYLAALFALPLAALYPIGRVPQFSLRWLVSIFIVAAIVGRPIAAIELRVGATITNALPNPIEPFVPVAILLSTFIIVLATQVGLIYVAHKGVSVVEGNIRTRSRIMGEVDARHKDPLKVEVDETNSRRAEVFAAVAAMASAAPGVSQASSVSSRMSGGSNTFSPRGRRYISANGEKEEDE